WLQVLQAGNGAEALKTVQRAIDIAGPIPELLDTRAVVYLALGQPDQAVKDLEEAVADTPTAHRYFHLAQAHLAVNHRAAAAAALRQGRALGLSGKTVDPLERKVFARVCADLDRR